jgi:hypothetical protein
MTNSPGNQSLKFMRLRAIAIVFLLTTTAFAQTNEIWFMPFTPPTNAVALSNLCLIIENQSREHAPQTHGVRVMLPHGNAPAPIRLEGTNWTMLDALKAFADITASELRLADDIALLLPSESPYCYIIVAVSGRCEDAATGDPINGILVKPEWPYDAIMYANTNGFFACGIPKRFLYWPETGALVQTEKESPGRVTFTLSAPGYEAKVVTNCFYQDYCGMHGQTFKLKREKGTANKVPEDTTRKLTKP